MKLKDFILRYPTSSLTKRDAICRVRLFRDADGTMTALLTDLGPKNTGSSVTNSVEVIWRTLINRDLIDLNTRIVEHYDYPNFRDPTCDVVTFGENDAPKWKHASVDEVAQLIGCDQFELTRPSLEDPTLVSEIDRIRHEIDPKIDEPYPEAPEVLARREKIKAQMLSKSYLITLIQSNSNEQELQRILKQDLSIIGEIYGRPDEEYIVFSEFPLDGGFVDFVVFSGRSCMEITLIEIKGANFNLITESSYQNFSAKLNEATQQMRRRLGYINRFYDSFRREAHRIRCRVESGDQIYNSLMGPQSPLAVDPNKDINLCGVVIGGRRVDDLIESKIRHEYSSQSNPKVFVESWDSWLNKLRRQ